jgi:hypothetical protein
MKSTYTSHDLGLLAVLDTVSVATMLFAIIIGVSTLHLTIFGGAMAAAVFLAHVIVFRPDLVGMEGTWG